MKYRIRLFIADLIALLCLCGSIFLFMAIAYVMAGHL